MTWLTVGCLKKSLNVELANFFQSLDTGEAAPTKSAFVQARDKIKPEYYADLFKLTVQHFYEKMKPKKWKGMRLWAVDGTGMKLPEIDDLGDEFGRQSNAYKSVPSSKLLVFFDVLNEIAAKVCLHKSSVSESTTALLAIAEVPQDVCCIYDRGFAGQTIPFTHMHHGSHCIVRLPVGFSNTVKEFVESGEDEAIITEKLSKKSKKTLRAHGFNVNSETRITYRLIRVILSTGEIEVLLTTLLHKWKYRHSNFKELYWKRWGVESFFFDIKSYFKLFIFSTIKKNGIWQDVYAVMILYNIQTVMTTHKAQKIKQVNKKRVHDYQPNRNVTAGLIKPLIVKMMFHSKRQADIAMKHFDKKVIQTMERVRTDNSRPRSKRLFRGSERHVHEMNYRPAI
jgi:Transposase DDE domain